MDERKIIIGLITSTDYIKSIRPFLKLSFFDSSAARVIAGWCLEYFDHYQKAPGKAIQDIFRTKLQQNQVRKDIAEEYEVEILPSLNEEYEQDPVSWEYLRDRTINYFRIQNITRFNETLQDLIRRGTNEAIIEAEAQVSNFRTLAVETEDSLNLHSKDVLPEIAKAFEEASECLVRYPKQLGVMWNDQMVRGALVGLMGSSKRGKTFWLLDIAMRACRQGRKVVFFQAGDMTRKQQLRRICIYLAQKSYLKKYCGKQWEPIRDCIFNQLDTCTKDERQCKYGIAEGCTVDYLRNEITLKQLIEWYQANPDYQPCCNCEAYDHHPWGTPWIREIDLGEPLTAQEGEREVENFFMRPGRYLKLSTHANNTLTVDTIRTLLDTWEKQEDFVPDVIVIDYADLLTTKEKLEERHKQNKVWKELRRLSQEKNQPLVITATQANARSYEQNQLQLSNFSEDRRKYDHCTAMFGLNQDYKDREKELGMLRINAIVIREGEYNIKEEVRVLQNLKRGRPFLDCFK